MADIVQQRASSVSEPSDQRRAFESLRLPPAVGSVGGDAVPNPHPEGDSRRPRDEVIPLSLDVKAGDTPKTATFHLLRKELDGTERTLVFTVGDSPTCGPASLVSTVGLNSHGDFSPGRAAELLRAIADRVPGMMTVGFHAQGGGGGGLHFSNLIQMREHLGLDVEVASFDELKPGEAALAACYSSAGGHLFPLDGKTPNHLVAIRKGERGFEVIDPNDKLHVRSFEPRRMAREDLPVYFCPVLTVARLPSRPDEAK